MLPRAELATLIELGTEPDTSLQALMGDGEGKPAEGEGEGVLQDEVGDIVGVDTGVM